jgi:DNA-binding transcriptional MerR regulator
MRIGEVAERTGTTPRTIRFYEELGLLEPADRAKGKHRTYAESDVERVNELVRLRRLLGVSLEELKTIVEAEEARASLRREWREDAPDRERRVEMLSEALRYVATQLGLVRSRRVALEALEQELVSKRRRLKARLKDEAP